MLNIFIGTKGNAMCGDNNSEYFWSLYCVSGTVGLAGTRVIPILQLRKPRHKEAKSEPRSDSLGQAAGPGAQELNHSTHYLSFI